MCFEHESTQKSERLRGKKNWTVHDDRALKTGDVARVLLCAGSFERMARGEENMGARDSSTSFHKSEVSYDTHSVGRAARKTREKDCSPFASGTKRRIAGPRDLRWLRLDAPRSLPVTVLNIAHALWNYFYNIACRAGTLRSAKGANCLNISDTKSIHGCEGKVWSFNFFQFEPVATISTINRLSCGINHVFISARRHFMAGLF